MKLEKITRNETLIYIILWCVVTVVCILHLSTEHSLRNEAWLSLKDVIMLCKLIIPLLVLFIVNNYVLIPHLLVHQHVKKYIVAVLLAISVTATAQYALIPKRELHKERAQCEKPIHPPHHLPPPAPVPGILYSLLVVGLNLGIWSLSRSVVYRLERSQLIAANVESQLSQLKTQINPHFYMNMLNSIHGLVDLNPPKAKDLIMDLSHLMQYMLYDSAQDRVSLLKEIKFLTDYIKIIKDRYPKGKVTVVCDFPGAEETEKVMVPPLLFIGFVENAFKHGVDYRFESRIEIKLSVTPTVVIFECNNNIHPSDNNKENKKGGIGLENIKKRLALIYQGGSDLEIIPTASTYHIKLTIPYNDTTHNNH